MVQYYKQSLQENGGGIYAQIEGPSIFTIDQQCQFQQCNSSEGNGGGIYIDQITQDSFIQILNSSFDRCNAINEFQESERKVFGSALFINLRNWTTHQIGKIDVSGAKYINCSADTGDRGLFIVSFSLLDLCRYGNPRGQLIRSDGYIDEVSDKKLLMGYFGPQDSFDYGESDSEFNDRIVTLEPIWRVFDTEWQWYVSNMDDAETNIACGFQDYPCETIKIVLSKDPSYYTEYEYDYDYDYATIVLLSDDMIESPIFINSSTSLNNKVIIKSQYGGEEIPPEIIYKISFDEQEDTSITVNENGAKLELQYLQFSYLRNTNYPLIYLTGNSDLESGYASLIIEGCIFEQGVNMQPLDRSLFQLSGGIASLNKVTIQNCDFSHGNNLINYYSDESDDQSSKCQLSIIETSIFNISQQGNSGGAVITGTINNGSSIDIKEQSIFQDCSTGGNGAVLQVELIGGQLSIQQTQFIRCIARNGGGISLQIISLYDCSIDNNVMFSECAAVGSDNNDEGRGGAIYANFQNDGNRFKIGYQTYFNRNTASKYGRDIFIYCNNIDEFHPINKFLFNFTGQNYNKTNAIYGTETTPTQGQPIRVDYDIIYMYEDYSSDTIYISSNDNIAFNLPYCGTLMMPCLTLDYGKTRHITPEWTQSTVITSGDQRQKINHTFIINERIAVSQPFQTESDNVIISGFNGIHAQFFFSDQGQII
ncbi:MAG: hypothetical protein EZS28_037619, partial [Streblomastix strix]